MAVLAVAAALLLTCARSVAVLEVAVAAGCGSAELVRVAVVAHTLLAVINARSYTV